MSLQSYRIEKDTLGEVKVPTDKYWGAQTQRLLDVKHMPFFFLWIINCLHLSFFFFSFYLYRFLQNFYIGGKIQSMQKSFIKKFVILKRADETVNIFFVLDTKIDISIIQAD